MFRPVCLITGGSSGVGLATAQMFAANGYDISICGRRERQLAESRQLILAAGQQSGNEIECLTIVADLGDTDQTLGVAHQTMEKFGRIDALVNNAASAFLAPFDEITPTMFESAINTNIRSLFYLTQSAWAEMKKQGQGVVVNISSLSAVDPFPGFSIYGACKSWMDLLTAALAAEGKPFGLRVCSVRPGAVETPLLRGLFPDFPADQCVQPQEVADVVWGCVSEPKRYPSGQAFPVTNQV